MARYAQTRRMLLSTVMRFVTSFDRNKNATTAPSMVSAAEMLLDQSVMRLRKATYSWCEFFLMTTLTLILTLRPSRRLPWPWATITTLLCAGIFWLCTELFAHRRRCNSRFDEINEDTTIPMYSPPILTTSNRSEDVTQFASIIL